MTDRPARKPRKKRGRPRLEITPALQARICREIAFGKSLRKVLKGQGMPSKAKILETLAEDDRFAAQYARARRQGIEVHIDGIIDLADTANAENERAVRLKVDVRKWLASKLIPKIYGHHIALDGDLRIDPLPEPDRRAQLLELARGLAWITGAARQIEIEGATPPLALPAPGEVQEATLVGGEQLESDDAAGDAEADRERALAAAQARADRLFEAEVSAQLRAGARPATTSAAGRRPMNSPASRWRR